jgi:hypothetical protein
MTARQPRRTRRRTTPASTLPRPLPVSDSLEPAQSAATPSGATVRQTARRGPAQPRAHHVENDYRYVRTDLLTVAAVGAVVIAFVVGMSFLI